MPSICSTAVPVFCVRPAVEPQDADAGNVDKSIAFETPDQIEKKQGQAGALQAA